MSKPKRFLVNFDATIIGYGEANEQQLANALVERLTDTMQQWCSETCMSFGEVALKVENPEPPGDYVRIIP